MLVLVRLGWFTLLVRLKKHLSRGTLEGRVGDQDETRRTGVVDSSSERS